MNLTSAEIITGEGIRIIFEEEGEEKTHLFPSRLYKPKSAGLLDPLGFIEASGKPPFENVSRIEMAELAQAVRTRLLITS